MTRSIFARVKTPPGLWQRFTGTTAEVIGTGFPSSTAIEWDDGTGLIREFNTLAPAASFRADYRGSASISDLVVDVATLELPIGPPSERDTIFVFVTSRVNKTVEENVRVASLQAIPGTQIGTVRDLREAESSIWQINGVTGETTVPFVWDLTAHGQTTDIRALAAHVVTARGVTGVEVVVGSVTNPVPLDQNVLTGDKVFALGSFFTNNGYADTNRITFTNMTELAEVHADPFNATKLMNSALAQFDVLGPETPRTMTVEASANRRSGISLRLRG